MFPLPISTLLALFVTSSVAFPYANEYKMAGLLPCPKSPGEQTRRGSLCFECQSNPPQQTPGAGLLKAIKLGRQYTNFPRKPSLLSSSGILSQALVGASKAVNMESIAVL